MTSSFVLPALLGMLALPAMAQGPDAGAPSTSLTPQEVAAIAIHDAIAPAVVQVDVRGTAAPRKLASFADVDKLFAGNPAASPPPTRHVGTGLAWDDAGHVVTTHAAVAVTDATITVTLADGSRRAARLIGDDPALDVAVLQVEGSPGTLHPLPLATGPGPRPGHRVFAIGNPYGRGPLFIAGMVSAVDHTQEPGDPPRLLLAIVTSPGDAGGPVVDTSGRLVGILRGQRGRPAPGVGIAAPVAELARVVPRLIAGGHVDAPAH
ncbi:MAG TPA: serine protease [Burkholderiaceae bacterium]